jgi:hypothetical protein
MFEMTFWLTATQDTGQSSFFRITCTAVKLKHRLRDPALWWPIIRTQSPGFQKKMTRTKKVRDADILRRGWKNMLAFNRLSAAIYQTQLIFRWNGESGTTIWILDNRHFSIVNEYGKKYYSLRNTVLTNLANAADVRQGRYNDESESAVSTNEDFNVVIFIFIDVFCIPTWWWILTFFTILMCEVQAGISFCAAITGCGSFETFFWSDVSGVPDKLSRRMMLFHAD